MIAATSQFVGSHTRTPVTVRHGTLHMPAEGLTLEAPGLIRFRQRYLQRQTAKFLRSPRVRIVVASIDQPWGRR